MEYKDQRKLFHISEENAQEIYEKRINSEDAVLLGMTIKGHQAFYCMNSEVYRLIVGIERADKTLQSLLMRLPSLAVNQYVTSCLIDEIILTNEIEGVNSSRKEIGDVLATLGVRDSKKRFHGIVKKYAALQSKSPVRLESSVDIRKVYDELVLDEVIAQKPDAAPDGKLFRAGPVSVLDAAQRPIHEGLEPESKIIETMDYALVVFNDEDVEPLVRSAIFHFLFAYIHPFYDGNGRTNRFLSSYLIAQSLSPLVGLRLSFSIKENIQRYYKAFSLCEHPLNKGDLTPFLIIFLEIVAEALQNIVESLQEREAALEHAGKLISVLPGLDLYKNLPNVGFVLAQAALFADEGISMTELCETFNLSAPPIYKRLEYFDELGLLVKRKQGRQIFYALDINKLMELVG